MGDDSEWLKLPTEDKIQHKVWKARVAGYEEATKVFNTLDEKSPEYARYAGHMKKIVTDSNAVAQDKGLDAVLAFISAAPTNICARICSDVVAGVVTKCLNAMKQKTKEKGMEIAMLLIEAEKPDIVQEGLMTGMENKQPKVVVGCVQTVTMALRDFGTKVISIKPLLKLLPKLLDDRDKNVREETKQLVIEIYRWIGAALKPQMTNFKPIQVQEFEAEFEKVPPGKPVQSRFMRSQQELKAKIEEQAVAAEGEGDGGDAANDDEAIDPFDLMTPVDILSMLPKPFYEQIEAKKWQERKEMLDAVLKLAENPRLENGDYGLLMKAILKVVAKDTNVMLVTAAAKIITGIANGLRKKFQPYAVVTISTIYEKFKEKKAAVVAALRDAIDASYQSTSLEPIMEDTVAALENKNPSIKAETALFLSRCFSRCTQSSLPKKMLKVYCAPLLKTASESDPAVREASFQALGTAMKVVTEKNIGPFLSDVDPLKMQKIQECCEKAVLLNAKGEPRGGAGGGAAPAAAASKRPATAPPPKAGSEEPKPVKRPGTAKPAASGAAKPKPKAQGKAPAKKGGKKGAVEEKIEAALSDETVEEKAQEFLPGDIVANMASTNWKERLAAVESMVKVVSSTSRDSIPCQVCIRVLTRKPGFKDNNFQVLKLKLELVAHLSRNSSFSKRSVEFCLPDIVDKLGDIKNGANAKECLTGMSEAVGLEFICAEAMTKVFDAKNPKNQQEALIWLATAVKEFGFKINVKGILPVITKALAATNPGVRTAAITLLGVLYMYMGDTLRMLFENEKPTLLAQIDAEFEKMKGTSPPAPTRRMISADGKDEEEEEDDGENGGDEDAPVQDLVPRNDISEKITEALLTELTDKNWKMRGEGLQKVSTILSEAKFVTPNLGSLPEALKARLGESNKMLQMTTIGICQTLAIALGPHSKSHIKVIGPGLLSCLADSKPALREKVITCLNTWVEHTTLLPLVESEALYGALKLENPFLRAELLGWLAQKLPDHKKLPAELKDCIEFVLACLEDRNADVRKKAGECLVPFMIHTGYDAFLKALGKCKPASKTQIQPLLEKAREEVPKKPVKAKPAAASAPSSAPAKPAAAAKKAPVAKAVEPDSDPEPEEEAKPAAKSQSKAKVVAKGKVKGKVPAAPSSKKKDEEDFGPPMTMTVTKEHRVKEEKNLKVLKWNFLELKGEYVEQLRNQMEKNFNKAVIADLFANDFKNHIKVIEILIKCIETQEKETLNNLDLLLKWLTIRFHDTNPSMLNKALDYLQKLFSWLADQQYHLSDLEAGSFVPYLLMKSGDPKDNVRRDVRNILKMMCKIYPSSKMFSFYIDGLKCKVAKQRAELLDELGCLIEIYGMNVCQPSPAHALKIIAQQIGDRDNGVRNAALNTIVKAHAILGETVYKYCGNLSDKDQSYLDERIKRAMKNKDSQPAAKPPPQAQPTPQQQQLKRPKTAPGGTLSKAISQPNLTNRPPVNKAYQLDIEMDDDVSPMIPSLIELTEDVDSVMAPITRPSTASSMRPASPMASKLAGSADASTCISTVVTQISAVDIQTSIKALVQIDEVMKDPQKVGVFADHVDNLLMVVTMQIKLCLSKHLQSPRVDVEQVTRLCRCLLASLITIFDKTKLGKKASTDMLKDLIQNLLTVLLDANIAELPDGAMLIKTVNLTVVKIINEADPTNLTCANIALMRECLQSETCSSKFMELVTKCLWKNTNLIPEHIDELNCDKILYESHLFFQKFPTTSFRNRPSLDLPIRTIKTLLHNITKLKGHKILSHTGLISASENSEVEAYLHTVLAKSNKNEDGTEKSKTPSKNKRMSKTHELLTEIFKKIGNKENVREGLNDLFDFKKKYPEADMQPFLKKTTPSFQKYINNMLSEIEEERQGGGYKASGDHSADSQYDSNMTASSDGENLDPNFYREKLRELRAKCGLDNHNNQTGSGEGQTESSRTSISKSSIPETSVESEPAESEIESKMFAAPKQEEPRQSVDVSDLKARLERIKKMANS